jgi:POT family proton-dependent oligopeptide transporter
MFGSGLVPSYAALGVWAKLAVSAAFLAAGLLVFAWRQTRAADDGFLAVLFYAARARFGGRELAPLPRAGSASDHALAGSPFWGPAVRRFGGEATEGAPAILSIVSVFAVVSVFWALFDQHSSSWIAQAREMDRSFTLFGRSIELLPEQISAANPALVMLLVPFMGYVVYPGVRKLLGREFTPLSRMTVGMLLAAFSFVIVALAQQRIDAGERVHIWVQLLAYLVLTASEVMVSVTGLEFAYTQAPRRMKSLIMGFWLLSVSLGNILVALLSRLEDLPRVRFFWTFAGLMLAAGVLFGVRAAFYRYKRHVQ